MNAITFCWKGHKYFNFSLGSKIFYYNYCFCHLYFIIWTRFHTSIYKRSLSKISNVTISYNWQEGICYDSLRFKDWSSRRDEQLLCQMSSRYLKVNTRINRRNLTKIISREECFLNSGYYWYFEICQNSINFYWKRYLISSLRNKYEIMTL